MNTLILTSSDFVTESVSKGFQAAFAFVAICWIIGLIILIGTIALITWVVKKVWYAGSNRRYKEQRRAERNIKSYQTQTHGYVKDGQLYSPTGWRWDEDAKLWVPPKNLK